MWQWLIILGIESVFASKKNNDSGTYIHLIVGSQRFMTFERWIGNHINQSYFSFGWFWVVRGKYLHTDVNINLFYSNSNLISKTNFWFNNNGIDEQFYLLTHVGKFAFQNQLIEFMYDAINHANARATESLVTQAEQRRFSIYDALLFCCGFSFFSSICRNLMRLLFTAFNTPRRSVSNISLD